MKHLGLFAVLLILSRLLSVSMTVAQPPFEVPLTVTDGVNSSTLYFGLVPGTHYCTDTTDCYNGHCEAFLPPNPPSGVFDARHRPARSAGGAPCYGQGSLVDFRPPGLFPTGRDTFRVKVQLGTGQTPSMSWPDLTQYFTGLTLRYFDQNNGVNVNVNMLTHNTVDLTNAFAADLTANNTITILSAGVVTSAQQDGQGEPKVPKEFALAQNFPNPFNPVTTIKYDLPVDARVTLKVFNLLGQEVETLINGEEKAGYRSVEWNASGFATGVYFYRLKTDGFTSVKKLILVK